MHQSDCHQWLSESRVHEMHFRRGCTQTPPSELNMLPRPIAGLRGEEDKERVGEEREKKGREGK